jgi:hypothetical protein
LEEYSGMDETTSEDLAFPSLFEGGTAPLSPFQRSPRSAYGSLPPLLGQSLNSCPATKGTYPLGSPKHRFSATMFSSREAGGVGPEDCLRKLRTVDSENTPLLPQRVKSGSVSGSALLTFSVRNHARSAFKRFSHPRPFAYALRRLMREWCEKSDWS